MSTTKTTKQIDDETQFVAYDERRRRGRRHHDGVRQGRRGIRADTNTSSGSSTATWARIVDDGSVVTNNGSGDRVVVARRVVGRR